MSSLPEISFLAPLFRISNPDRKSAKVFHSYAADFNRLMKYFKEKGLDIFR